MSNITSWVPARVQTSSRLTAKETARRHFQSDEKTPTVPVNSDDIVVMYERSLQSFMIMQAVVEKNTMRGRYRSAFGVAPVTTHPSTASEHQAVSAYDANFSRFCQLTAGFARCAMSSFRTLDDQLIGSNESASRASTVHLTTMLEFRVRGVYTSLLEKLDEVLAVHHVLEALEHTIVEEGSKMTALIAAAASCNGSSSVTSSSSQAPAVMSSSRPTSFLPSRLAATLTSLNLSTHPSTVMLAMAPLAGRDIESIEEQREEEREEKKEEEEDMDSTNTGGGYDVGAARSGAGDGGIVYDNSGRAPLPSPFSTSSPSSAPAPPKPTPSTRRVFPHFTTVVDRSLRYIQKVNLRLIKASVYGVLRLATVSTAAMSLFVPLSITRASIRVRLPTQYSGGPRGPLATLLAQSSTSSSSSSSFSSLSRSSLASSSSFSSSPLRRVGVDGSGYATGPHVWNDFSQYCVETVSQCERVRGHVDTDMLYDHPVKVLAAVSARYLQCLSLVLIREDDQTSSSSSSCSTRTTTIASSKGSASSFGRGIGHMSPSTSGSSNSIRTGHIGVGVRDLGMTRLSRADRNHYGNVTEDVTADLVVTACKAGWIFSDVQLKPYLSNLPVIETSNRGRCSRSIPVGNQRGGSPLRYAQSVPVSPSRCSIPPSAVARSSLSAASYSLPPPQQSSSVSSTSLPLGMSRNRGTNTLSPPPSSSTSSWRGRVTAPSNVSTRSSNRTLSDLDRPQLIPNPPRRLFVRTSFGDDNELCLQILSSLLLVTVAKRKADFISDVVMKLRREQSPLSTSSKRHQRLATPSHPPSLSASSRSSLSYLSVARGMMLGGGGADNHQPNHQHHHQQQHRHDHQHQNQEDSPSFAVPDITLSTLVNQLLLHLNVLGTACRAKTRVEMERGRAEDGNDTRRHHHHQQQQLHEEADRTGGGGQSKEYDVFDSSRSGSVVTSQSPSCGGSSSLSRSSERTGVAETKERTATFASSPVCDDRPDDHEAMSATGRHLPMSPVTPPSSIAAATAPPVISPRRLTSSMQQQPRPPPRSHHHPGHGRSKRRSRQQLCMTPSLISLLGLSMTAARGLMTLLAPTHLSLSASLIEIDRMACECLFHHRHMIIPQYLLLREDTAEFEHMLPPQPQLPRRPPSPRPPRPRSPS